LKGIREEINCEVKEREEKQNPQLKGIREEINCEVKEREEKQRV
jgi:hypothetical protein